LTTIAIVDDDPDDIELLVDAISQVMPATFLKFSNAQHAVETLTDHTPLVPDCIFTDYNMPLYTGEELILSVRNNRKFQRTIITALSTSMPEDLSHKLKNAGADFTFQKPADMRGFSDILRYIFSHPILAHLSTS